MFLPVKNVKKMEMAKEKNHTFARFIMYGGRRGGYGFFCFVIYCKTI